MSAEYIREHGKTDSNQYSVKFNPTIEQQLGSGEMLVSSLHPSSEISSSTLSFYGADDRIILDDRDQPLQYRSKPLNSAHWLQIETNRGTYSYVEVLLTPIHIDVFNPHYIIFRFPSSTARSSSTTGSTSIPTISTIVSPATSSIIVSSMKDYPSTSSTTDSSSPSPGTSSTVISSVNDFPSTSSTTYSSSTSPTLSSMIASSVTNDPSSSSSPMNVPISINPALISTARSPVTGSTTRRTTLVPTTTKPAALQWHWWDSLQSFIGKIGRNRDSNEESSYRHWWLWL